MLDAINLGMEVQNKNLDILKIKKTFVLGNVRKSTIAKYQELWFSSGEDFIPGKLYNV